MVGSEIWICCFQIYQNYVFILFHMYIKHISKGLCFRSADQVKIISLNFKNFNGYNYLKVFLD